MEWNKDNIDEIVEFINRELKTGRPMNNIELEEFGVNERVIHKRLLRIGYKKIDNQYRLEESITSNITKKEANTQREDSKNFKDEVNNERLLLLLDNLDEILSLINKKNSNNITSNITGVRSNINDVRSFRIDTGIYEEIKKLSYKSNETIGEIINIALEQYLKNL